MMFKLKEYFYCIATDQAKGSLARILKGIFFLLSQVYRFFVTIIISGYEKGILRKRSLKKPVICVGNITLGGVGKTPLVILVAQFLQSEGLRPVILTRGYMGHKSSDQASDEATLLKEALVDVPVIVGADRFKSGRRALEKHQVDAFILDDGYQHWRLKRDLDIVMIDSTNPFGNGFLIPRGVLREPVNNLSRAQIFVLSKIGLGQSHIGLVKETLSEVCPEGLVVETRHQPKDLINVGEGDAQEEWTFLMGRKICSFCSIGDPSSFEKTLKELGAEVKKNFAFMDHHKFTQSDIDDILTFCQREKIDTLVTTEKDIVKLQEFKDKLSYRRNFLYLKIKIQISKGQDEFFQRISSVCNR